MLRHSALHWRSWEWPGSWASELMLGPLPFPSPLHDLSTFAHLSVATESLGPASPSFVSCGWQESGCDFPQDLHFRRP